MSESSLGVSRQPDFAGTGGAGVDPTGVSGHQAWWRDAAVYEVYPRSFCDFDGDGEGDLNGLRAKLDYLADLGVDAIWIAPWFPSPMADGGYDVSDYRDIDPRYGTLEDAVGLIGQTHDRGIKVIIDMVANHTSEDHPWFRAALIAPAGSAERDRYIFRDGSGPEGSRPPNNWISAFGGSAWTRVTEPGGTPGQWFLHTFATEQPDLNWANDQVREEFDAILRFWFDRGVDGIRIDAAPAFHKTPTLPDADYADDLRFRSGEWEDNPHWDVDEVHEIFKRWRRVADEYDGDRLLVAEAVVASSERLARYLAPDEIHTAFNFEFLKVPWDPGLRQVIDQTREALAPVGAPATWVLGSHDELRLATRYGREDSSSARGASPDIPSDIDLGTRRLRAAALLLFALPGTAYIFQGDELALPSVDDIPEDRLQDPIWTRSGHTERGRDACRVPLPWSGHAPPFGFSPSGARFRPWLPQPHTWAGLTVEAQLPDPHSTLNLHRRALRLRREIPALRTDAFAWRESPDGVLDFDRGPSMRCVVNLSGGPVSLDLDWDVLISSVPLHGPELPHDAAVWLTHDATGTQPAGVQGVGRQTAP
jgi:alpha-glucosidase